MKTKTPKPRLMWAVYPLPYNKGDSISAHPSKADAEFYGWNDGRDGMVRVAVIPLVNLDELVVKCVGAYWTGENKRPDLTREEAMRLALTAAGIPCKRRARK